MFKKEAQHFGTRIRTGGVRVTASCIAARPRVRRAMNRPQLSIDTVAGNQPRDGTCASARVGPTRLAADVRLYIEAVHDVHGIRYMHCGIGITMKDDHGPLRCVRIDTLCL